MNHRDPLSICQHHVASDPCYLNMQQAKTDVHRTINIKRKNLLHYIT